MMQHAIRSLRLRRRAVALAGTILAITSGPALAQSDDRPEPAAPRTAADAAPAASDRPIPEPARNGAMPARPEVGDDLVTIAWDEVGVKETFPWIARMTGKVVMPLNITTLGTRKFTLLTDAPVPRSKALDLLFQAFRLNSVGVIEREDVVIIGLLDEIKQLSAYPMIDADQRVQGRDDKGSFVLKLFQLERVQAEDVLDLITATELPSHVTVTADPNSNQLLVHGDIGFCQHVEKMVDELDDVHLKPRTETFRLRYADATNVSENILDLFESSGTTSGGAARTGGSNRNARGGTRGAAAPQSPAQGSVVGPDIELRVTVSTQQNSVTVTGDPLIVANIANLIDAEWDLPRSPGTSRIFQLEYTDPIKVADKINSLLGQSSGTAAGGRTARGGAAGGGGGDASQILSGIYQIEAFPDSGQILVFSKTEESLDFLTKLISDIDQPTPIGLPFVIELKHANAFELAEQLNALLAEAGAGATITAPETGLTGETLGELSEGGGGTDQNAQTGQLNFPWQRGGRQRDDQSPESPLVGKVRIVPISRQNALAILCPRPQQEAIKELIDYFDRPGRQVLLQVVLAEVELTQDLNLGIRWSSSDSIASAANPDNLIGTGIDLNGSKDDWWSQLFDTSIIDANMSLNVVLQALDQRSNLRIIQQPMIFTADNQEAFFFDGQEIPFITTTTINSQGNPTDSFDYRNVGLIINARPRITKNFDIDVELRVELSAVVPGVQLFGGAVLDRRTTSTHVVVKDGQTIVLSGLLRESESKITRGVPFLEDIPILGELFKSRENQDITSELIAFITPRVVDNPDQNDVNFQEGFRNRLDEMLLPVDEQLRRVQENPDVILDRFRHTEEAAERLRQHYAPEVDLNAPRGQPVDSGVEIVDFERGPDGKIRLRNEAPPEIGDPDGGE